MSVIISKQILSGGQSIKVAISTTSAQSPVFGGNQTGNISDNYSITPDVTCFIRMGTNPTAVADGTDQILFAGNTYRVTPCPQGSRFAFITSTGTGNVYLTPND